VLVGTPIGNLGDLSPRARTALEDADVIACEDTRHTRKLLTASGISGRRLVALHQHNEDVAAAEVVRLASGGATVAVVTDAGMPGISDPGELVVRLALQAGVAVEVVPGPSAVVAALVLSGLPTSRFAFEGFLPRKGGDRRARLVAVAGATGTTVIYEAPGRVAATLADLVEHCGGDRPVALVREITKRFEETWRGSLADALAKVGTDEPRGEWVLVLGGASPPLVDDETITSALHDLTETGSARRAAVDDVAATLGVPRNRVYRLALGESPSGPGRPPR
jgi:16S rRNA (cytidine1402-2'-O)-methyltransferase